MTEEKDASAGKADAVPGALAASGAALKTVTDALEALKKVLGGPQSGTEAKKEPELAVTPIPSQVDAGLAAMAAKAAERYRTTIRWMLGAFAAVAIAIFGSLPFADVGNATDEQFKGVKVGLSAVALGVALAIWAVSRTSQPQVATLGELQKDFKSRSKVRKMSDRVMAWFSPPRRARNELRETLEGDDGHFGPGWDPPPKSAKSPKEVIHAIGQGQLKRYLLAGEVASSDKTIANLKELLTAATDGSKAWWDRAIAKDGPGLTEQTAREAFLHAAEVESALVTEYETGLRTNAAKHGELAALDARLLTHFQHRNLVLIESALSQLKGAFILSRRLLIIAALLVAFGASKYAAQLPLGGDDETPPAAGFAPATATGKGAPVTVTLRHAPARVAERCEGEQLAGVATSDWKNRNDPLTLIATSPTACAGTWTLEPGDYDLLD